MGKKIYKFKCDGCGDHIVGRLTVMYLENSDGKQECMYICKPCRLLHPGATVHGNRFICTSCSKVTKQYEGSRQICKKEACLEKMTQIRENNWFLVQTFEGDFFEVPQVFVRDWAKNKATDEWAVLYESIVNRGVNRVIVSKDDFQLCMKIVKHFPEYTTVSFLKKSEKN